MNTQKNELTRVQSMPVAPAPPARDPAVLSLRQAAAAIFRSKWMLFTTTMLGLLGGVWLGLVTPNEYVSHGKFLIRPGGEQIVIDPVAGVDEKSSGNSLLGNAEAILESEEVLRRTVARVGAGYVLAPYAPALDPQQETNGTVSSKVRSFIYALQREIHRPTRPVYKPSDALLALQENLEITKPKDGQILEVSMKANDARRAQRILEAFMTEAQQRHVEVYSAERDIQEVETSYETAKKAHADAAAALATFLVDHAVQDFEGDLEDARQRAATARQRFEETEARVQTGKTTLAGLQERLKALKPTVTVTSLVPVLNARVPVLQDRINAVETELLNRRGVLRENDPQILHLENQLQVLKAELSEELAKKIETRQEMRDEPSPEYLATKQNISQLQLSLVVDEEQVPSLREQSAAATRRAEEIGKLVPAWRELSRIAERRRTSLDQAEQMLALARKKSELDRKRISSLAVLDAPTLPILKEGPQRTRMVLGGLLVGFFLGIVLVVLRALTDTTIRSVDDLEEMGAIKILATIPNLDRTNVRRHESMRVTSWT